METVIVVLHYNNEKFTNDCVDSIFNTTPLGTEIVVVDNNSTVPYVRDDVVVLRNTTRHCVSGMNLGFYHAVYNMNAKYVVNLDNDIICLNGWLQPLIKEMEQNPQTGVCGGKQWNKEMTQYRSVGWDFTGCLFINFPEVRAETVWIQGSFHMYRAEMMKWIGLHDTRYKNICSDSDYCLHALDRNWKVVFVPESSLIHYGNASFKTEADTGFLTDNSRDIQQLTGKWCGIKFNELLKQIPMYARDGIYGRVEYTEEVREECKKQVLDFVS